MTSYEVVWTQDALGLRFTPNDLDQPVICEVPGGASADVLQSRAAVGDVLLAVELLARGTPREDVESFDHGVALLQRGGVPMKLFFQSREHDVPTKVDPEDIADSYTFTWQAGHPLGVSLAMDPCTLHAAITKIDPLKISPEFQALDPAVGDVLVKVSAGDRSVELDHLRFESIIDTLRTFERPCQLEFAQLAVELMDESTPERKVSAPAQPTTLAPLSRGPAVSAPPAPSAEAHAAPKNGARRGRPWTFATRPSFRIDKSKSLSKSESGEDAAGKKEPSAFYKVTYGGGRVGLHLYDCSEEDKTLTKSNGYSVAVREVVDAQSAEGLEQASPGDLLVAIERKDLQHMSFDSVRTELGAIRTPTQLLFKRRKKVKGSTASNLVDALMLFLI